MPLSYIQQVFLLLKRLSLCYLFYFAGRLLFFALNAAYFGDTSVSALASDCFYGLWFDSFSIAASNLLFILLSLLPLRIFYLRTYQRLLLLIFAITNSVFLAFNFIDVAYFPFIRKRSTADLFSQLGGQSDIGSLLPAFLAGYWWLALLFAVSVYLLVFLFKRIRIPQVPTTAKTRIERLATASLLCVGLFLTFLALRGGLQKNPIDIVNAGSVTTADRVSLVLNTPFTLIKTLDQEPLPEHHFFSAEELPQIFNPIHQYKNARPTGMNLVVLVLESFSKEYCALGRKQSFTPFLDSLMQRSLVFTNAFSNSTKSIEGIPAILSGLPSYMDIPFINSMYANNAQSSLGLLLAREGYETAFFHGGTNGTMNFTEWAALAGYRHYFGRDEYGDEADFDGFWGIWDEPFLQFSAREMAKLKQPFHSAVFTLSSHHPYRVPGEHAATFKPGKGKFEAALRYADFSLKKFFATAATMAWYRNTLFVLVADHAIVSKEYLNNPLANFTIPVLFYKPDNSLTDSNGAVFSQVDVLPQTLQLLGYNKAFFAYGKDPGITRDHISCYYGDGYYYVFTDSMLFTYNGLNLHGVHNYFRDSALKLDVRGNYPELENAVNRKFKAVMQTYNHTLISNSGVQ